MRMFSQNKPLMDAELDRLGKFLGGCKGGRAMNIEEMDGFFAALIAGPETVPLSGEKGIYFVESLQRRQVHPFYGWDQGHFLIKTGSDGAERVTTRNRKPVLRLDSGQIRNLNSLSSGVASGVSISDETEGTGLTVTQFKQTLREMMRAVR